MVSYLDKLLTGNSWKLSATTTSARPEMTEKDWRLPECIDSMKQKNDTPEILQFTAGLLRLLKCNKYLNSYEMTFLSYNK